jgi:tetratricopeptide (TPR) repeat protein
LLSSERSAHFLARAKDVFQRGNLSIKSIALRSIFRIDINARRNSREKHTDDVSEYAIYLKQILSIHPDTFERIVFSLIIGSDYSFGRHSLSDSLDALYKDFIAETFSRSVQKFIFPYLRINRNKEKIESIISLQRNNWYATAVVLLADFFKARNMDKFEKILLQILVDGLIPFAGHEDQEIHNFSVAHFKLGDLSGAVQIAKHLVEKNPYKADDTYLLLSIYCHDQRFQKEFAELKNRILNTFNLSTEEREKFENLEIV